MGGRVEDRIDQMIGRTQPGERTAGMQAAEEEKVEGRECRRGIPTPPLDMNTGEQEPRTAIRWDQGVVGFHSGSSGRDEVHRMMRNQRVAGSYPVVPTKFFNYLRVSAPVHFLVLRPICDQVPRPPSNSEGHRPRSLRPPGVIERIVRSSRWSDGREPPSPCGGVGHPPALPVSAVVSDCQRPWIILST